MSTDIEREERAIYAVAIVVLLPVVIIALARHLTFDGGTTVCLGAVVLGAIGLVGSVTRTRRLPRARASRRS